MPCADREYLTTRMKPDNFGREGTLCRADRRSPAPQRSQTLRRPGHIPWQGEIDAARALFEQAIAFNHSDAHPFRRGNVLAYYAYAIANQGDFGDARPLAEEALAIGIQEDQPWMQQIALLSLGVLAFQHQDHAAARALFERALVQSQRLGDRLYIATALSYLGLIDLCEQAQENAYKRLAEALQLARAIRSPKAITLGLDGLASLWASWGEWERATQLFGAIEMVYLQWGHGPHRSTTSCTCPSCMQPASTSAPKASGWPGLRARS